MTIRSSFALLAAVSFATAQSPLSISNELTSYTPTEEFTPDAEWTFTATWALGAVELGLENILYMPELKSPDGDDLEGEVTLSATWGLHDFLSVGASATQTYLLDDNGLSLAVVASPAYADEALGLEITDDNELAYDLDSEIFVYTNTLLIDYTLHSQGELSVLAELEHEIARALEDGAEWESVLSVGPVVNHGPWSLGVFYAPALLPDVEHGFKVTLGHSL